MRLRRNERVAFSAIKRDAGSVPQPSCVAQLYVERSSAACTRRLHGRNLFWFYAAQSIRDFVHDAWKFMIFSFVCSSGRSREKFIRRTLFKNAAQRHGTARLSCVSAVKKKRILKYYRGFASVSSYISSGEGAWESYSDPEEKYENPW